MAGHINIPFWFLFVSITAIHFSSIGWFSRTCLYNYYRGRLDGRGMKNIQLKNERSFRVKRLLAWIFLPIGMWYLLGWYAAGNREYELGKSAGEGDRREMDRIAENLIEQYYIVD